jgi:hypothetical protein
MVSILDKSKLELNSLLEIEAVDTSRKKEGNSRRRKNFLQKSKN